MSLGKAVKDVTLQGSGKGLTACGPREMACSPADTWGCGDGETPQYFFFLTWSQIIQHVYTKRLIYYIMKRSTAVFFSHGNFYATMLCFGAGFYHTSHGPDGAHVTAAIQSSKGTCVFWKCEMMRYSSAVCFPETPVQIMLGQIQSYFEQPWQPGTMLEQAVLLFEEMQLHLNFLPWTCQTLVIVCCFSDPFPVLFWSHCMADFSWLVAFCLL